jgi:hypothetical protein
MVASGDTGLKDRSNKWGDVLAEEAKAQTFKDDLAACEKFRVPHLEGRRFLGPRLSFAL